ncbi:MAG: excisionase family DNA-binding protein [Dehalococcoidales bacterium]|nr:excisionase family DNA-binding protein [Dehalococcoidales bacterium]
MDYITTKEAGARIGLSDSHIRRLIKAGNIRATKLGHDWLVDADLFKYHRKRRKKGETMDFILKARCPINGDVIAGIGFNGKSVYQARQTSVKCPHHDHEMEIVEVIGEGILWQDRVWLKEEARTASEIDKLGRSK